MDGIGDFSGAMGQVDRTLLELFGRPMDIQDQTILAVLDEERYRERVGRQNSSEYAEGVWRNGAVLICGLEDLGFRPEYGDQLTVDGKDWTVTESSLGERLLEITLEANES